MGRPQERPTTHQNISASGREQQKPMTTGRAHFTRRGIERGGQDRFQKPTKTNSKKSYAAIKDDIFDFDRPGHP